MMCLFVISHSIPAEALFISEQKIIVSRNICGLIRSFGMHTSLSLHNGNDIAAQTRYKSNRSAGTTPGLSAAC